MSPGSASVGASEAAVMGVTGPGESASPVVRRMAEMAGFSFIATVDFSSGAGSGSCSAALLCISSASPGCGASGCRSGIVPVESEYAFSCGFVVVSGCCPSCASTAGVWISPVSPICERAGWGPDTVSDGGRCAFNVGSCLTKGCDPTNGIVVAFCDASAGGGRPQRGGV